jgi:5-methylcytosine-specific restriction enzyme B
LKEQVPSDFYGIPIIMSVQSWFFPLKKERNDNDIQNLWNVFKLALTDNPLENKDFYEAFDKAIQVKFSKKRITTGLFWIRPDTFVSLDSNMRSYLNIKDPGNGLSSTFYVETIKSIEKGKKTFYEISREAVLKSIELRNKATSHQKITERRLDPKIDGTDRSTGDQSYSINEMLEAGVFLERTEIESMLQRLKYKKAMILQGAPGVGKTFIARKLAFLLMGQKDHQRVEFVQFHQSYSYDDFVRGYRPLLEENGAFGIKDGIFYEFCQKAIDDPDRDYVFIIDEINRGNLSQIFGEILMLIESDKRGEQFSIPLIYRTSNEERFYIPSNLYLIGLMNIADRSLAMVDYALRRRFIFYTLEPQYENEIYKEWLENRSMNPDLIDLIISKLSNLNQSIRDDLLLGENYQIGHSYFCPEGDDFSDLDQNWYKSVIQTEIIPLIKEYWFDNQARVDEEKKKLLLS